MWGGAGTGRSNSAFDGEHCIHASDLEKVGREIIDRLLAAACQALVKGLIRYQPAGSEIWRLCRGLHHHIS